MADRYNPHPAYDHSSMMSSLPNPPGNPAILESMHLTFDKDLITMNNAVHLPITSSCSQTLATSSIEARSMQGMDKFFSDNTREKESMYGHPLFPLLTIIFEKCELATCSRKVAGESICSSESFNEDIVMFSKELAKKNERSIFTSNPEIDNIMIQAIQNFRFHLIELEKVHELCDNFCERYSTCLKEKMVNDLNDDLQEDDDDDDTSSKFSNCNFDPTDGLNIGSYHRPSSTASLTSKELDESLLVNTFEPYVMSPITKKLNHKETKRIKIKDIKRELDDQDERSICGDEDFPHMKCTDGETPVKGSKRQKKRGIFSKAATNFLRSWLFQHFQHPYPSEEQKKQLGSETGLTILQVNNWFINARRRIVQPMIDQTHRSATASKSLSHPSVYADSAFKIDNHVTSMNSHRLPGPLPVAASLSMSSANPTSSYDVMHSEIAHVSGNYMNGLNSGDPYEIKPVYPTLSYMESTSSRFNMIRMPCYSGNDIHVPPSVGNAYYNYSSDNSWLGTTL